MGQSIGLAALLLAASTGFAQVPAESQQRDAAVPVNAAYIHNFERVKEAEEDPASLPVKDGVIWYGTWEGAMAERDRSGKPIMLHMGSPRDRSTRVPGAW
jgi:hypothetical protein